MWIKIKLRTSESRFKFTNVTKIIKCFRGTCPHFPRLLYRKFRWQSIPHQSKQYSTRGSRALCHEYLFYEWVWDLDWDLSTFVFFYFNLQPFRVIFWRGRKLKWIYRTFSNFPPPDNHAEWWECFEPFSSLINTFSYFKIWICIILTETFSTLTHQVFQFWYKISNSSIPLIPLSNL